MVHFPVALWMTASLFDVLFLLRPREFYGAAALWLIALGALGAVVATVLGFFDLNRQIALGVGPGILAEHRTHSFLAYASSALYGLSFAGRWRRRVEPPNWVYAPSFVGAMLIMATSWYGGELRRVM